MQVRFRKGTMKKYFLFAAVSFLTTYMSLYSFAMDSVNEQHKVHQHEMAKDSNSELSGKLEEGVRVIEVKASRYKFEPGQIVVRLGEKVRLIVTSMDVAHGLAISGFKIKLSIPAGQTASTEFVADKKGTFHVYCSVYCGPGHGHMHASFIVK